MGPYGSAVQLQQSLVVTKTRRRYVPRKLLTYSKLGGLVEKPKRRRRKNLLVVLRVPRANAFRDTVLYCPELVTSVMGAPAASNPRGVARPLVASPGWLRQDEVDVASGACREWLGWAARVRGVSRLLVATPSRVSLVQTWSASVSEELASHSSVAPLARTCASSRGRRKPRHWCSSMALGPWDGASKTRAVFVANWEGDAILEYALGLDNRLAFVKVFASDPRLRHPEGIVFWKGRLRVCASYYSAVVAVTRSGRVDASRTINLHTTEWCWGLAVDPETDRLLVSTSPPYDFQADLPGDSAHVAYHGELLEVDERRVAVPAAAGAAAAAAPRRAFRHSVRVLATGLTRPGGMAFAPKTHPHAGDLFLTEYGVRGAGRVLRFARGPSGLLAKHVYLDLGRLRGEDDATPDELINPWSVTFAHAGDALYVATDPNHRAVLHLDGAGNLVKTLRRRGEAPNFVLCA